MADNEDSASQLKRLRMERQQLLEKTQGAWQDLTGRAPFKWMLDGHNYSSAHQHNKMKRLALIGGGALLLLLLRRQGTKKVSALGPMLMARALLGSRMQMQIADLVISVGQGFASGVYSAMQKSSPVVPHPAEDVTTSTPRTDEAWVQ